LLCDNLNSIVLKLGTKTVFNQNPVLVFPKKVAKISLSNHTSLKLYSQIKIKP